MPPELRAWLKSSEYLPEVLRDFHDQKDFFKFLDIKIGQRIEERKAEGEDYTRYIAGYNWVMLQILSIDFVLWFLAAQGYTLQRSRKRLPFYDWDATKEAGRQAWFEKVERENPAFFGKDEESQS